MKPDQRKFSVIVMKDPADQTPKFFVMVGHSFGLVSAVYNYNRRSAFINEVLVSLFGLVAFSFYDDKYGFEPASTVASAHLVAQSVHWWLGAHYDQKKLQLSRSPTILGVTYDLEQMVLLIKERKSELPHFRFPTLPALRVITLGVWRGGKREGTGFGLIMHGGSPHVGF